MSTPRSPRAQRLARLTALCAATLLLASCGGGGGGGGGSTDDGATGGSAAPPVPPSSGAPGGTPTTTLDATRLAHQASFGPTEALVADIRTRGPSAWLAAQMTTASARYTRGGNGDVHQWTGSGNYCDGRSATCWRDNFSSQPLLWDFYRNAVGGADQLRQRVAFALQKIVVVSNLEVEGTYGMRYYYNTLLDNAFGNYRQVLKKVALSPLMGDYLNNANNDKAAPNENFARELLQLFSIGTCELNANGTLKGGACSPTYGNETVRHYAYALTGWTYPAGGSTAWGCWPQSTHCRYYAGDMVPVAQYHDTLERPLLSGITVPAGSSADQALEAVLDSLMQHPNMAPFIGRQLIQQLVASNPSAAYVGRVAAAFNAGRHQGFGSGQRGDLAATVAAVLLDAEARSEIPTRSAGKLREPVLHFTGVLRALGGRTDGDALGWWWGETMRQHVFRPPSVFNYFPPDYPLPGVAGLKAPEFGIHNANTSLERLNYLTYLLWWGGSAASADVPGALGTRVDLQPYTADAADAAKLVDRLSTLALGARLPSATRTQVIAAVEAYTAQNDAQNWATNRVRQAAYLVFGSPNYQVQR
ncbi:DUF1800 domain-containing protein [Methylibium petroleiphilum]|uniref:Lipoprotein n=1 Tax=Methylibium petroleiphilum (strain ATCC BAA-1232 / LMG 22953 / PM1) TaxID=420662 RepID=A2SLM7_METPP|nr:DUF1800 domain-containing protein [Methylibium petroleiphilum]ABM96466.1 conserved hypothetical protein [Methylibium petroleiphilum PM1]